MFKPHPIPTISRAFFTFGWIVAILMALAHGSGNVQKYEAPTDEERALIRAMETVNHGGIKQMTGKERSYDAIMKGYSWHYTVSFLMLGVACAGVRLFGRRDVRLFRFASIAAAVFVGANAVIAGFYFFLVPLLFTALMSVCFVMALLTSKPRADTST